MLRGLTILGVENAKSKVVRHLQYRKATTLVRLKVSRVHTRQYPEDSIKLKKLGLGVLLPHYPHLGRRK